MKVILFGATGMIGQGVLRECLLEPDVERVLAVVRRATGQKHDKLRELVHEDFLDFSRVADQLAGHDACLFCLGVSSAGMKEPEYQRVTYDITMAAADTLARSDPGMTFLYVSGAGTDGTEQGSTMWARVKGKTENALLRSPFRARFMFRPALIQPLHGIRSSTTIYRILYRLLWPLFPLLRTLFPKYVTTTERVGRAMLDVARHGAPRQVLENHDINQIAAALK